MDRPAQEIGPLPRLMLVTDRRRTRGRTLVEQVAAAVRGGVGLIQVRERDLGDAELAALVREIRHAVPHGTPILVNGRPRVARELACGLHLPAAAPAVRRAPRPWGRSAHEEAEALFAAAEGVSYLVLGHVFETPAKPGRPGHGAGWLGRIARRVEPLPIYAIGGITVSRIPEVIHAGAWGVAVCGAILSDNDPGRVAGAMALAIEVSCQAVARERGE